MYILPFFSVRQMCVCQNILSLCLISKVFNEAPGIQCSYHIALGNIILTLGATTREDFFNVPLSSKLTAA